METLLLLSELLAFYFFMYASWTHAHTVLASFTANLLYYYQQKKRTAYILYFLYCWARTGSYKNKESTFARVRSLRRCYNMWMETVKKKRRNSSRGVLLRSRCFCYISPFSLSLRCQNRMHTSLTLYTLVNCFSSWLFVYEWVAILLLLWNAWWCWVRYWLNFLWCSSWPLYFFAV